MTRHLLKLIWNRKRTNFLLMAEIFFSFLVLFAVVTLGLFYLDNYRQPLGYDYADVWCVHVDTKAQAPMGWSPLAPRSPWRPTPARWCASTSPSVPTCLRTCARPSLRASALGGWFWGKGVRCTGVRAWPGRTWT